MKEIFDERKRVDQKQSIIHLQVVRPQSNCQCMFQTCWRAAERGGHEVNEEAQTATGSVSSFGISLQRICSIAYQCLLG